MARYDPATNPLMRIDGIMEDQPLSLDGASYDASRFTPDDLDDLDTPATVVPPGAFYRALLSALERLRRQPTLPPPTIA
jgi:hypothetical protein